ncbi:hypothetical protein CB1_000309015 [Camelus ferus]|nr:hypothetical protein CB1_000309015 [Camelus ferus]
MHPDEMAPAEAGGNGRALQMPCWLIPRGQSAGAQVTESQLERVNRGLLEQQQEQEQRKSVEGRPCLPRACEGLGAGPPRTRSVVRAKRVRRVLLWMSGPPAPLLGLHTEVRATE